MSNRLDDTVPVPVLLPRRATAILLLGSALLAAPAVGQVAGVESGTAATLVCTPLPRDAEERGEQLWRCRPASVVGGEVAVTTAAATDSSIDERLAEIRDLLRELNARYEEIQTELAALRALRTCPSESRDAEATGWPAPEGPVAEATGDARPRPPAESDAGRDFRPSLQPTDDLLWRTLQEEGPPPEDSKSKQPEDDGEANTDDEESDARRRFSLLDFDIGGGESGNLTFGVAGRYFSLFGDNRAVQVEGSYQYYHQRREGQFDLGLVNRRGRLQLGLFSSLKYVSLGEFDDGATLAQAAVTLDWKLDRGRFGLFGAAGLRDRDRVDRRALRRNFVEESFLEVLDQVGISGGVRLNRNVYLEGSAAYLIGSGEHSEIGGALRLVYPLNETWALTTKWSWNDTLVPADDGNARFTIGLRAGTRLSVADSTDTGLPVPVDIPRVRYQVTGVEVRTGNDAPIADAGPDQSLSVECASVGSCSITVRLDGSGSFDPDGDSLTYSWTTRSGFDSGERLASTEGPATSFVGLVGGRYVVRLTVSDGELSGFDDAVVSIRRH